MRINRISTGVPNAWCFSGLRVVKTDGALTELALLRQYRDKLDGKYNGAVFKAHIKCSQTVAIHLQNRVTVLVPLSWLKLIYQD